MELCFFPTPVIVGFLAVGMRGASGQFSPSGLGNFGLLFVHPETSSMAVTQWTVQIKRSACGSRLRSWCLTRAVHETGSMSELPNMPFFPDQ